MIMSNSNNNNDHMNKEIYNINNKQKKDVNEKIIKTISLLSSTTSLLLSSSKKTNAVDDNIDSIRYKKAPINVPSDDFW